MIVLATAFYFLSNFDVYGVFVKGTGNANCRWRNFAVLCLVSRDFDNVMFVFANPTLNMNGFVIYLCYGCLCLNIFYLFFGADRGCNCGYGCDLCYCLNFAHDKGPTSLNVFSSYFRKKLWTSHNMYHQLVLSSARHKILTDPFHLYPRQDYRS